MAVLLAQPSALRLRPPRAPRQRPLRPLQGARLAAAVRRVQGGRARSSDDGAAHLPQARQPARRATPRPGGCRGWRRPPARSARGCPSASASRWPGSGWTAPATGCGCCAATANWPRARCGRPPSTPGTSTSTTSPRSSTSTGSASAAPPGTGTTWTPTPAASQAFGWHTIEIDGHDVDAVDRAYGEAASTSGPAHRDPRPHPQGQGRRGRRGPRGPARQAAAGRRGGDRRTRRRPRPARRGPAAARRPDAARRAHRAPASCRASSVGDEVATRDALRRRRSPRSAPPAGTSSPWTARSATPPAPSTSPRSTPTGTSSATSPSSSWSPPPSGSRRAAGCRTPRTFAAFLTRAHDFVRMASISGAGINLVGSHAGVAIGQDGPSQMGLEDLAMMRAVHGSTVLYPCDANQTARLVAAMAGLDGVRYLRTSRGGTPGPLRARRGVPGRRQQGAALLRRATGSPSSRPGVTVHEALAAADALGRRGHPGPGDRPVLGQARRPPTRCAQAAEDDRLPAHRRGPPPGGRPRRRGPRRLPRRPPGAPPGAARRPYDARLGRPRASSCTPPASTPRRSPRPAGCWWSRRSCRER